MAFEGVLEAIRENESFLIVGHQNPDGDSIGCQLALAEGLQQLDKDVSIQAYDPVPDSCANLPGAGMIKTVDTLYGTFDAAILVECSHIERSGFHHVPVTRILGIDHHPGYSLDPDDAYVDETVAAAAELVYDILEALGCTITKSIAQNLLYGLVTDSGSFTYNNTQPSTLRLAANLVEAGASLTQTAEVAFRSYPVKRIDLITDALSSLRRFKNDAIAVMLLTHETIEKKGYENGLFEDLVNIPLSSAATKASVLIRQNHTGEWQLSLRSKGTVDVGKLARKYGGGGHRNAAGFRHVGDVDLLIEQIVEFLQTNGISN